MNLIQVEALLTKHEGRKLTSYTDTRGNVTIGIGRNLKAKPITVMGAQVDQWFEDDVDDVVTDLSKFQWFLSLDDARQSAIIDLAFNLGTQGLFAFAHMIAALTVQDWRQAHDELLKSTADHQEPNRIAEDAEILLTGVL
jgi:lysozyme